MSFCYEDTLDEETLFTDQENLDFLKGCTEDYLCSYTKGVDRGVTRPVQCDDDVYNFTVDQKRKKQQMERYIKRFQRRMARQKKTSNQRKKTKYKLARVHQKMANIREDFCHKTSRKIVEDKSAKILIFEDLGTKNLTKRPKAKKKETGGWEKNRARAKAGLNKAILDKSWHKLERYTKYKAYRAGKAVFKIPAHHTSQECSDCCNIHPDNRKTQAEFVCERCGYTDNADHNAAKVIKKRAIKLILNSGTELSKRGVLLDTGRGGKVRHGVRHATYAVVRKRQKDRKSRKAQYWKPHPFRGVLILRKLNLVGSSHAMLCQMFKVLENP